MTCPDERPEPVPDRPLTLAEVDGDLRLLAATLHHVEGAADLWIVLTRIAALRELRRSLVAAELDRAWRLTWPGDGPPEWSAQASGEGAS